MEALRETMNEIKDALLTLTGQVNGLSLQFRVFQTELARLSNGEGNSEGSNDRNSNGRQEEMMVELEALHVYDRALTWHQQVVKRYAARCSWELYEQKALSLKDEISMPIRMFKLTTLADAFSMARMQEATNNAIKQGLPFKARMGSSPDYNQQPSNSFEWRKTIFEMITSMGIRHPKPYTLRVPITTTMFAATTPENIPMAYRASTSANPNLVTILAFVEANYEAPESLLRDRRRQLRNDDLRTELEYFSKDYDEEREMKPRPEPTRAVTLPLRVASPRIRRRGKEQWGLKELRVEGKAGPFEERREWATFAIFSDFRLRRTRSLVERLSTDLPSTYKGLLEKTYTWVEAREVATNGASSDRRDNFERSKKSSWDNNRGQKNKDKLSPYRGPNHGLLSSLSKSPKEILATEKATRSFEPPPKMFRSKRARDMSKTTFAPRKRNKKERTKSSDTPRGESKKVKGTTPAEAPILMSLYWPRYLEERWGEYTWIVEAHARLSTSNDFEKLNPTIKATKVDLKTPLVGFSRERSWSIGEVPLEITIGDTPLLRTETLNFVILRNQNCFSANKTNEGTKRARKILTTNEERILSCVNIEEKIIMKDKYLDQTVTIGKKLPDHFKKELQNLLKSNADVFAWTHADMTGISRTIMVEGKPFNTEHRLNEYNHVKPIKQNKRSLGPDRNMAACKETEELTKARIL
nr:hypothetical protein [Tanacetum cinerariifolium]